MRLTTEVQGRAEALARWLARCRKYRMAPRTSRFCAATTGLPRFRWPLRRVSSRGCAGRQPERRRRRARAHDATAERLLARLRSGRRSSKDAGDIERYMSEYNQLASQKKHIRTLYLLFLLADHAVHSVRRHMDRAAALAADQRAHLRAAGGRQRGAHGQPGSSRARSRPSTNWPRWFAPSTK